MQEVWKATRRLQRLGELAEIHRGIECNLSFRRNERDWGAKKERAGFVLGLHWRQEALEPFQVLKTVFLNALDDFRRGSTPAVAWHKPKLVVNAIWIADGNWSIVAAPDYRGLVCYRNFHGIWPSHNVSLEVLAAFLNGPVANAFVSAQEGKRDIKIQTLQSIPIPTVQPDDEQAITSLVRQYSGIRKRWLSDRILATQAHDACKKLLQWIDAEVLKTYDLPPRVERSLLDHFSGHARPGPIEFTRYFPEAFKPGLPWHRFLSGDMEKASAAATLIRQAIIDDPLISEAMENLNNDLPR